MRSLSLLSLALVTLLTGCAAHPDRAPSHATYTDYAVACDHVDASRAGARMLEQGGNAIDAAVAASFALSVVRPHSCGLGGGGFMVIHQPRDPERSEIGVGDPLNWVIDYRERAPGGVEYDHFFDLPDDASRFSGHAVAIPGTVAGLLEAHETFGTLPIQDVMAPAIRLARKGYIPGFNGEHAIEELARAIDGRNDPGARWLRATYIDRKPGSRVVNEPQARLLEQIAQQGMRAFYTGDNAKAIIDAVQGAEGVMTLEDLRTVDVEYAPAITMPVDLNGTAYTFVVMPPPSSGGVAMLETLGILAHYHRQMVGHVGTGPLDATSPRDPVYMHALTECLKMAFADRARQMGDPKFGPLNTHIMLDDAAQRAGAGALHPEHTMPTERYGIVPVTETGAHVPDDHGTSHLSVIDAQGNAVSCTETINLVFGSRIAVPELGIVLNNEMDDFLTRLDTENAFGLTQSQRNLPAPGKRPLSSMSPTIVLDANGEVIAVAGASGGPRIITGTLHALMNALLFGRPAREAVDEPRWHHQWKPDAVYCEPGILDRAKRFLAPLGHEVRERKDVGAVQLLVRRNGVIEAASDPRKGGAPAGH